MAAMKDEDRRAAMEAKKEAMRERAEAAIKRSSGKGVSSAEAEEAAEKARILAEEVSARWPLLPRKGPVWTHAVRAD